MLIQRFHICFCLFIYFIWSNTKHNLLGDYQINFIMSAPLYKILNSLHATHRPLLLTWITLFWWISIKMKRIHTYLWKNAKLHELHEFFKKYCCDISAISGQKQKLKTILILGSYYHKTFYCYRTTKICQI